MPSITIRLDDDDRQIVERAKQATYERTASKALLRCAALYPGLRDDYARRDQQLRAARAELDRLREAIARWGRARDVEARALSDLEALAELRHPP